MRKILVIQTASLGDVIIATALLEKLHAHYPEAEVEMLVQKPAASLLKGHPFLHHILTWDKKNRKYAHLLQLSRAIRKERYDLIVNVQRFAATGWLCWRSKARQIAGFDKNPFSCCYTHKIPHQISSTDYLYEADRNQRLITAFTDAESAPTRLYPTSEDEATVGACLQESFPQSAERPAYCCISPASLWFTKQYPTEKWVELIQKIPEKYQIILLGSDKDRPLCEEIIRQCGNRKCHNLAGKLSLLQSAALMRDAVMNYTNDSAPLHLAVAVGAKVTALFCSTVPSFGFAPKGENIHIIETEEPLLCRPCGIHGHQQCPEGHFRCGYSIETAKLLEFLPEESEPLSKEPTGTTSINDHTNPTND